MPRANLGEIHAVRVGCAWVDAGVRRATTALLAHRALRAMYWKQRCELSGEPMPVDVPAGLPSNTFVLKLMRNADTTLKKVRYRDSRRKTVCLMSEVGGKFNQ